MELQKELERRLYLVVAVDTVETIEVGLVAVLVPPAPHVGPGTVDSQRVGVFIFGRERATIVIPHGVTWQT